MTQVVASHASPYRVDGGSAGLLGSLLLAAPETDAARRR